MSDKQPRRTGNANADLLLSMPPMRAVLRLATPTTLVMLVAATSNVLYTWYVSKLGPEAIAAVSLVFPISLIAITAMGGGIGAGAASAVARALGAGRHAEANSFAEHAIVLSVGIGIVFAATLLLFARPIFTLMGGRGEVLEQATTFARVLFGGSVITFVGAMFDSVLRGEGNVRVSSIWSSTSLGLQIILTPIFMFVFGLNLVGSALAVLTSQFLATIPRAWFVWGGHGTLHPRVLPRSFRWPPVREVLRVGVPASMATFINYLGLMILTGIVARFGNSHLAAYGLGTRLDFLMLSFAYGVGSAVLTLVGMTTGAQRPERAGVYAYKAMILIGSSLGVIALALFLQPTLWLGRFTTDPELIAIGSLYFHIIAPSYPFVGIAMVVSFSFQGLGRATLPMMWMIARVITVLVVSIICTSRFGMTERAVFTCVSVGNVLSAGVMLVLLQRTLRSLHGATLAPALQEQPS